jgi:hypothetical protein
MSKDSQEKNPNFRKEANDLVSRFYKILDDFSSKKDHELYEDFWHLRADLEILIVEIQHSLDLESSLQKWQKNFFEELKGTRSKTKAKTKLDEFKKVLGDFPECSSNKLNECYKILWKLKEVIASVLSAFPAEKYKWINGEFQKEEEKVFEI